MWSGWRRWRCSRLSTSVSSGPLSDLAELADVLDQLAQRHLALVVADDDLVDRDLGDDPVVAPLLGGQQRAQPVGVALADQDDARGADHAVDHVLLLVEGDQLVGLPAAAQRARARAPRRRPCPPSGRTPSFWARRPKSTTVPSRPSSSAPTIERIRLSIPDAREQREQREADGRAEHERAEQPQADVRVGLLGHAVGGHHLLAAGHLRGVRRGHRCSLCRSARAVGRAVAQAGDALRASMA